MRELFGRRVIRWASLLLAVSALAAVWAGREESGADDAARPTELGWVTYDDSRHRFSVRYPKDWYRAAKRLTPNLEDPREILSLGTYPLRAGGDRCAQFPVNALEDLGPEDAFISIQERQDPTTERSGPRPRRFRILRDDGSEGSFCVTGPRLDHWVPFKDSGRAFYALYVVGESAPEATRRDVRKVLESLSFEAR